MDHWRLNRSWAITRPRVRCGGRFTFNSNALSPSRCFLLPLVRTPESRAEFASEWETLKKIQHPAIVRCFGGGFEETDAYLAHELIEGETLAAQLEHRTRLSWEAVLEMAEPIADALTYLHARDIVHGALQPDKIMFAGLSPVLIDVRVNRTSTPFRTNRPPTPDEIALLPPELVGDPTALSPHTDLYSLGALLYLALTGRPPVDGDTIEEVSANVVSQIPASPASIVMDCPVWFDKLVMQLLEKDPANRPHGAPAVGLALAEVRRRSMSRAGVAEHASAGFSPLNVTDQKERDEARVLLGHGAFEFDDDKVHEATPWHDRPLVLIVGLALLVGVFTYFILPLNEDQMRRRAEALLTEDSRNSLNRAKVSYLVPMLEKYPEGQHASWRMNNSIESRCSRPNMRCRSSSSGTCRSRTKASGCTPKRVSSSDLGIPSRRWTSIEACKLC